MRVWLIYYERDISKNRYFIEKMISEGKNAGIDIKLVTAESVKGFLYSGSAGGLEKPDAAISRAIDPALSESLEKAGIKVFNKASAAKLCNNKAETIRRVNKAGITHIPTIAVSRDGAGKYEYELIESEGLDTYNHMLSMISGTGPDSIFGGGTGLRIDTSEYVVKSVTGHGGREVMLLSEFCAGGVRLGIQQREAAAYYSDKYVIQPFLAGYPSDVRVYAVGKEIIGAVKRTRTGGFKANYSLGGSVSLFEPDGDMACAVEKILALDVFSYIGIDFLYADKKTPVFNEIEDVVGARMLSACGEDGYVKKYIEHIRRDMISC